MGPEWKNVKLPKSSFGQIPSFHGGRRQGLGKLRFDLLYEFREKSEAGA